MTSSYESDEHPWDRKSTRDSLNSLKAQFSQAPDLGSSIMAAAVNKSSIVSNPWDAQTEGEEALDEGLGPRSHIGSSGNDDLPPSRAALPPSLFNQRSLLDNTRPLISTSDSSISITQQLSASSLDYVSPSDIQRSAEPEPDPWSATIPKLDEALNGHHYGVERSPIRTTEEPVDGPAHAEYHGGPHGERQQGTGERVSPRRLRVSSLERETSGETLSPRNITRPDVERIKISIAPEKGGFLLKHVNYILHAQNRRTSVLRRYSDFLWLLDILVRRYPFRAIPSLPPKKVGDQTFLERRRRALSRFINLVANHPVFSEDEAVTAFLRVEMDIHSYRKKAPVTTEEETSTGEITSEERSKIPADLAERMIQFKANLDFFICQYRDLGTLTERIARREDDSAVDMIRCSLILHKLNEKSDCTEKSCSNCRRLGFGYDHISNEFQRAGRVMEDESQSVLDGLLENIKTHRDLLIACQELFYRQERALAMLNPDALKKRLGMNEEKLRNTEGKPKEVEKLQATIEADRKELEQQGKRMDTIRYCTWREMLYYHQQKANLSLMFQEFVSEKIRLASHYTEIWKTLAASVFELPTAEYNQ
ncbi:uncharacterized protein EV422DRAFT_20295 [Fimicolochytrium jonesii]|uniref:uncharacterized protein n=1 Tax=Fimicolochytrium jonesii TaxID=1396493 RepID=UPI0022FE6D9E|nr:uncharacterized protein EV422DRAFT_20295 [Fimicolochytrium jonesii]KAI8826985.1 hypothetical protein EV422DRAFT_20295 [Fimicolochytrium jonesii]